MANRHRITLTTSYKFQRLNIAFQRALKNVWMSCDVRSSVPRPVHQQCRGNETPLFKWKLIWSKAFWFSLYCELNLYFTDEIPCAKLKKGSVREHNFIAVWTLKNVKVWFIYRACYRMPLGAFSFRLHGFSSMETSSWLYCLKSQMNKSLDISCCAG